MDVPDEPEVTVPAVKVTKPVATPKPKPVTVPKASIPSPVVTTVSPSIDTPRSQSPAMSAPEKPATPPISLASMSKEEKEIEMARRREERKAVRYLQAIPRAHLLVLMISFVTENRGHESGKEGIISGITSHLRPARASLDDVFTTFSFTSLPTLYPR
jgi:hypothetical protein